MASKNKDSEPKIGPDRAGDISGNDFEYLEREQEMMLAKGEKRYVIVSVDLIYRFYPEPRYALGRNELSATVKIITGNCPRPGDILPWECFGLSGLPGECLVERASTDPYSEEVMPRLSSMSMISYMIELRPVRFDESLLVKTYAPATGNVFTAQQEKKIFLKALSATMGWPVKEEKS